MPPQQPGMPPDQKKQVYRNISTKPNTATLKDGVMVLETEFGYQVTFKMIPYFGINTTRPWMKHAKTGVEVPEFQTAFNFQPMDVSPLPDAKTKDEITKILKDKTVLPAALEYDNFTIGFIYATDDNPMNHKWMFEFRKNKNIFHAMHFNGVNIDAPFSTTSWHDGIYHGRFQMNKEAFKKVLEDKPGWVTITGNDNNKHRPKGDTKMIPETCKRIRFRFNIKTDYWYGDLLDAKEESVAPPMKMHDILGDGVKLTGHVDWDSNPAKPRVMFFANCSDIKECTMMAETLVIRG